MEITTRGFQTQHYKTVTILLHSDYKNLRNSTVALFSKAHHEQTHPILLNLVSTEYFYASVLLLPLLSFSRLEAISGRRRRKCYSTRALISNGKLQRAFSSSTKKNFHIYTSTRLSLSD